MASLEEIRNNRLEKLEKLKKEGINPYPVFSSQDYTLIDLVENFGKLSKAGKKVSIVGRVMSLRPQGGLTFFNLDDGTAKFQGLLKKGEAVADDSFELFSEVVDIGDFVEVEGKLFVTKREEKTIQVGSWKMLSKSLRPLPEKWHGLVDVEERFRKRYLDALMSPEVKNRFLLRARLVSELRKILDSEGFVEFETPVLQPIAGGATAEPFLTHHNALDIDLYLRIAPELYLKELLVAGFPKVYEIGRLFRNEGIDATHNPEFTTVEWYEAYSDADKQMIFVEKLIRNLVKKVVGSTEVTFDKQKIDFSKKFSKIAYLDLLRGYALISHPESITRDDLSLKATQLGIKVDPSYGIEKIMDAIYKKTCRPKLIQPTFITDYPKAFSPLAKQSDKDPEFIERFQIVVGGFEVLNAFSELNDPIEQRERFTQQEKKRIDGDAEAQPKDENYIEAMEYGMPPAGGLGLSIDRMAMLLTDTKNIREVIFFPTLRPKG
ncbi:MAG: lysine--tRNA ligase [Parcubacteria group bacterium]|nr:lysine--tRNA ligase [Parcubacteria group bacterium]